MLRKKERGEALQQFYGWASSELDKRLKRERVQKKKEKEPPD